MVLPAMPGHSVNCHIILHGFGASMHTYGSGSNPIPMNLDKRVLQSLPKVLLHEHLDGVLRPQTVIRVGERRKIHGSSTPIPMRFPSGSFAEQIRGVLRNIWRVLRTPSP